jgi:hypothetical protein
LIIGHAVPPQQRERLIEYVEDVSVETRIILLSAGDLQEPVRADVIIRIETSPNDTVEAARHLIRTLPSHGPEPTSSDSDAVDARPKKLLYVASTEAVAVLRTKQLREAGYSAVSAVTFQQIERSCEEDGCDLVVVGPAVGPMFKAMIAKVVRKRAGRLRILETGAFVSEIEGADSTTADSGENLLKGHPACIAQQSIPSPPRPS